MRSWAASYSTDASINDSGSCLFSNIRSETAATGVSLNERNWLIEVLYLNSDPYLILTIQYVANRNSLRIIYNNSLQPVHIGEIYLQIKHKLMIGTPVM